MPPVAPLPYQTVSEEQSKQSVQSFLEGTEDPVIRGLLSELIDESFSVRLAFMFAESWVFLHPEVRDPEEAISASIRAAEIVGTIYSTWHNFVAYIRPNGTRQDWFLFKSKEERKVKVHIVEPPRREG